MELKISSPCPMRWESLTGDDRIRYCGRCQLNVYNLAEMSQDEVENIFRTSKGRVCGRLYLRGDRTATLRDCPEGRFNGVSRRVRTAFAGLCVLVFALVFRNVPRPDLRSAPKWVKTAVSWIDPKPPDRRVRVVGEICPLPSLPLLPPQTPTAGP